MKKIALFSGGIPNFKFTINNFFERIKYTKHDAMYDVYLCLWENKHTHDRMNFVSCDNSFDYEKFKKILPSNFTLKKVAFIKEPEFLSKELIKSEKLTGKVYEKIQMKEEKTQLTRTLNLIDSTFKQFFSLKHTFELCKYSQVDYDYYMRFRLDGITNYPIDFNFYYEWIENSILVPSNNRYCIGKPDIPMNDQLAISDYNGMKIYCSLIDHMEKYVLEDDIYFTQETLLSYHLLKNNLKIGDMFLDHYLIRD